MIRIITAIMALAIPGVAWAQPAPRVTLDVDLAPADGFKIDSYPFSGKLAVGRDGTHYVLHLTNKSVPEPRWTAADTRIDLLALAPDGVVKQRLALTPLLLEGDGFGFRALGIVVARSGDLGIFMGANVEDTGGPPPAKATSKLLRLSPDFRLKNKATVTTPAGKRVDPGMVYDITVYLPTSDNAILLGGGYGIGPVSWWMGKFSLDGVRLWQGVGHGFPENVAAIRERPDGSTLSLVSELVPPLRDPKIVWFIRRNATNGKLLSRTPLTQNPAAGAILRDSIVVIPYVFQKRESELIVLGDGGRVLRRAPWPFGLTSLVIEDGDGIAAIVAESDEHDAPKYIVRADTRGVVRWRSAAIEATEIVRTPDGQIAALVRVGTDKEALRLMRFADP